MLGSACNLKMHVPNLGYTLSMKIAGRKTTFFDVGKVSNVEKGSCSSTSRRGLIHRLKFHELWSTNGLKLDRDFYPKFCILLHCHASHTEVSKQNSAKLCDMLGSKHDLQTHAKIWGVLPPKMGSWNYLFCDGTHLDTTMPNDEK